MATVQTIVNRAARLLGEVQSNTDLPSDESADALVAINALLDSWRNDKLLCYALRDEAITLVSAQTSYTVGTGGNLATDRPVIVEAAYVLQSTNSYFVDIITAEQYAAIPDKSTQSSWPDRIWVSETMPTATVYTYPVSNGTAATLHILTRTPVLAFAAMTDTVTLPPGWEEALASNLALALAPEYNTQPSAMVLKMATASLARLKVINSRPLPAFTELPMLVGRTRKPNILTGSP